MADDIRITLDLSGFGAFQAAALDAIEKAVEQAAEAVVEEARAAAPVSAHGSNGNPPGFLRDHIVFEMTGKLEAHVESQAEYSGPVEFGHHHPGYSVAGRPYFTPAVEAERARFAERIATAVAEAEKTAG